MIHEVDAAIGALIRRDAVNGGDVEVDFDAPTKEWSSKRTAPTIDCYLFDIREDTARRQVEREPVRDDEGVIVGRRRPPRRYRLSYLVTAWTQRPEDEHRLLSAVLHAFLPHEEMPRELLEGSLADQDHALFLTVGLPPPPERSIGEIWSAMGGELKPSLELTVSTPFVIAELREAGPPVQETPRFTFDDGEGRTEELPGRRRPPIGPQPKKRKKDWLEFDNEETLEPGKDGKGRVITIGTKE